MESLIQRARNLLAYMSPEDIALQLQGTGVTNEDSFLAVKAAVTIEAMETNETTTDKH